MEKFNPAQDDPATRKQMKLIILTDILRRYTRGEIGGLGIRAETIRRLGYPVMIHDFVGELKD